MAIQEKISEQKAHTAGLPTQYFQLQHFLNLWKPWLQQTSESLMVNADFSECKEEIPTSFMKLL